MNYLTVETQIALDYATVYFAPLMQKVDEYIESGIVENPPATIGNLVKNKELWLELTSLIKDTYHRVLISSLEGCYEGLTYKLVYSFLDRVDYNTVLLEFLKEYYLSTNKE